MEPEDQQTPQKPNKGYGKRPVWQWVLIYVVIAIVVYGLIYLLFIHKGSSTGSSSY
jgi:flagellar basal body-associated protein FliL